MTDAELDAAIEQALNDAHNAPFSKYSMDHRGHTTFEHGYSTAWAQRGNEWARLCAIRDARKANQLTERQQTYLPLLLAPVLLALSASIGALMSMAVATGVAS